MKGFIRFITLFFSFIIIMAVILVILYVLGIINNGYISHILDLFTSSRNASITTITISGLVGVLAVIAIVAGDSSDEISKGGLIIPLEIGKVCISNQTFENIVLGVAKKYAQFRNVKVNIKVSETGLFVNVYSYIIPEAIVADITAKLQEDVKVSVLKQTTIEVKEVNVKIKGVVPMPEKLSGTNL